jgi:hypothetical protein
MTLKLFTNLEILIVIWIAYLGNWSITLKRTIVAKILFSLYFSYIEVRIFYLRQNSTKYWRTDSNLMFKTLFSTSH